MRGGWLGFGLLAEQRSGLMGVIGLKMGCD